MIDPFYPVVPDSDWVARLVPEEAPDELARLIVQFVETRSLAAQRRAPVSPVAESAPTAAGDGGELV